MIKLLLVTIVVVIGILVAGCSDWSVSTYNKNVGYCNFEKHGIEVTLEEDHNTSQYKGPANPNFQKLCSQVKGWYDWTKTDIEGAK